MDLYEFLLIVLDFFNSLVNNPRGHTHEEIDLLFTIVHSEEKLNELKEN